MPVRDIDYAALGDLRRRDGAADPRGRVVAPEGDTRAALDVVLQGRVDMAARDRDGGEPRLVRIVAPGEFIGDTSGVRERPCAATAVVHEAAVLLCSSQAAIAGLRARCPWLARGVIQASCDNIQADAADVERGGTQPSDAGR